MSEFGESPNVTNIPSLGGLVDTESMQVCFTDESSSDPKDSSCSPLPDIADTLEAAGLATDGPTTGLAAYWEGVRKGADSTIHAFE